jgi:hypothetical protein
MVLGNKFKPIVEGHNNCDIRPGGGRRSQSVQHFLV